MLGLVCVSIVYCIVKLAAPAENILTLMQLGLNSLHFETSIRLRLCGGP